MAPDRRLVDEHQVDLARFLCREAITYLERQLGSRTLRPPSGRALIRRLDALQERLEQLEQVIAAIKPHAHSEERTHTD